MEQNSLNCVDLGLDQSFAWMVYVPAETFVESMKKLGCQYYCLRERKLLHSIWANETLALM